jgi:hypothetical protein
MSDYKVNLKNKIPEAGAATVGGSILLGCIVLFPLGAIC